MDRGRDVVSRAFAPRPSQAAITVLGMRRTRTPWLLALPLMLGGSLAARWLASVCLPHAEASGAEGPHHTESGFLLAQQLPTIAGVLAVLALAGLVQTARHAHERTRSRPAPVWVFLCLSPLAFLGQELAELASGSEALTLGPHLLLGLLLQLPFALAAYWFARVLKHLAEHVVHAFARLPRLAGRAVRVERALEAELKRQSVLALGYPGRAPPAFELGARITT